MSLSKIDTFPHLTLRPRYSILYTIIFMASACRDTRLTSGALGHVRISVCHCQFTQYALAFRLFVALRYRAPPPLSTLSIRLNFQKDFEKVPHQVLLKQISPKSDQQNMLQDGLQSYQQSSTILECPQLTTTPTSKVKVVVARYRLISCCLIRMMSD